MATFLNITSPDLALAAVPARRAFTNADGSPSFRYMLEHFRDEVCGDARRKVGSYGLRTIAEKLRHVAKREEIATGWHPLRATADAFDAQVRELHLGGDNTSRAFAVLALAAGRPALGTRIHNGVHLMDLINRGDATAVDLAASPLALAGAVALNAAGERLLREAHALAAPRLAVAA